mmetsp:Transcript_28678/g.34986  ORF Transcript_28678/g.34986 Transcript_28678/m.34986 type:complete len:164 (-) Transcript_28678:248-739(-)
MAHDAPLEATDKVGGGGVTAAGFMRRFNCCQPRKPSRPLGLTMKFRDPGSSSLVAVSPVVDWSDVPRAVVWDKRSSDRREYLPTVGAVPGSVQHRKQEGREEQQRLPRKRVDPHHWGPNPNQWGTTIPRGPNPHLLEVRFPRWGTKFPHRKSSYRIPRWRTMA